MAPVIGREEPDLIDLVNDLQNKLAASGHSLDISLPQIVVVGCQSAGKSSVLENFVGKEFLPRGSNVVTRRPTVVQMYPTPGEEYAIFLHKPDEKFTDFSKVKEEIQKETNREPGITGFSSKPISLKIFSPNVLKLTLVDLPGLIKIAMEGQTERSIAEVREMVLGYIQQPKCIILAVTPANQDLANSDALDIARIADPNRERTIGVLTKLDLMDAGTDAREILQNQKLPLKRGYVGVLNRSQKDIEEGKDIQYILNKEKTFFDTHPSYSSLCQKMGTQYLQRLLQRTLRAHIKSCLPAVRDELSQRMSEYKRQLKALEMVTGEGPNRRQYYVIKLMNKFIEDTNIKIMGHSELAPMRVVHAGAFINYILYTEIQKNLNLTPLPNEEELSILIANLCGLRNAISVPTLALDAVCRQLISFYLDPMERSLNRVTEVLTNAITESAEAVICYSTLRSELLYRIRNCIEEESEKTWDRLSSHIESEMFYVNLGHPDFDSSVCDPVAPAAGPVRVWDGTESEDDDSFTSETLMRKLQKSEQIQRKVKYVTTMALKYMEIVQKQIGDVAIKYIVFFLVKKVLDFIKNELVPSVLESGNIVSLTEDCEEDFRRKEEIENICACVNEALDAIQAF